MDDTLHWSAALQRILMRTELPGSASNPRTSRYPSGDIWKCILGASISADLESGTENADTEMKRFIRIDELGLSGVIFYCAPARRACIPQSKDKTDALIERSAPRVVYFPNFACTSFVIGQVIKSHLLLDPTLSPKPHPSGLEFSLNSRAFETLGHTLTGGSLIPIRDLSRQLKPTLECPDRVIKDREHAERLLLAIRSGNTIQSTAGSTLPPPSLPELSSEHNCSCPEDVEDEEEEYHDALDTLPHSPLSHANVPIPSLDAETKLFPSVPVLRHHALANILPKLPSAVDPKNIGEKLAELAGEKENSFSG
ncbi:hypothetical protein DFH09DRAFT_1142533 [Mycena vulgaris]|nr:hypothetical protein DFH09DRAFT_1142533 [Mycena vulgaris]